MSLQFLVRYGLRREVGRFVAGPQLGTLSAPTGRGQAVVVRTHRGTELGEVIAESPPTAGASPAAHPSVASPTILRLAGPDDFAQADRVARESSARYAACLRVFEEGVWPLELIDVEPLLDDRRTVLHYLGPHRLDVSGLRAALRATCGLDIVFEPVGRDLPEEELADPPEAPEADHGCGSCGSGGGCGSGSGSDAHGGCSGCAVKALVGARSAARAT